MVKHQKMAAPSNPVAPDIVDKGHVIQPTWNLNSLLSVSAMGASTAAPLNDFVSFLRRTLKTRIMYCKNAQASNGPRRKQWTIGSRRRPGWEALRHSIQTAGVGNASRMLCYNM